MKTLILPFPKLNEIIKIKESIKILLNRDWSKVLWGCLWSMLKITNAWLLKFGEEFQNSNILFYIYDTQHHAIT